MPSESRTVILVPATGDDPHSPYWKNFVWRVRQAINEDGLDCRILVAQSAALVAVPPEEP